MSAGDGMNYAPSGPGRPVVEAGGIHRRRDAPGPRTHLRHGQRPHRGRRDAEVGLRPRPGQGRRDAGTRFPDVQVARSFAEVLDDPEVGLVASAAIPSQPVRRRPAGDGGGQGLLHRQGADDHPGPARVGAGSRSRRPTRTYAVYYSERLHVECAVHAGELVHGGAIGRVIQVLGTGPHRLNAAVATRLVLRQGGVRRDPVRHRQSPDRAVPLLQRRHRRQGPERPGGQLQPPRPPWVGGLRRGQPGRGQRGVELPAGRLVHPRRPADLG